jgi:SAM-dependent methyltransferase
LLSTHPSLALDIGTGTGKVAAAIAARGVRVLGVDPDAQMAAVARARGLEVEVAPFETWTVGVGGSSWSPAVTRGSGSTRWSGPRRRRPCCALTG